MFFRDRSEAGKLLSDKLRAYAGANTIVYALPRGGVVVGGEVAKALNSPLEVVITRKIGHPTQPEYAIAAISENGEIVQNPIEISHVDSEWLKSKIRHELEEAKRRRATYKPIGKISAKGKVAIIVDDGVATGLTIMAAIKDIKAQRPEKIILALPVAPCDVLEILKKQVDRVVCIKAEAYFSGAVGSYYHSFPQVEDFKVKEIISKINLSRSLG